MRKETIISFLVFCALVVVIVISIKLTYKNYQISKQLLNGKILCSELLNASIKYYKENGHYLEYDKVSVSHEYSFDARTNPYFSTFSTYPIDENTQGISVFGTVNNKDYEIKVIFNKDDEIKSIRNINIQTIKIRSDNLENRK
jgi:hypothetical protein